MELHRIEEQKMPERPPGQKLKRFRIVKLEERIAPAGGGNGGSNGNKGTCHTCWPCTGNCGVTYTCLSVE